MVAAEGSQAHRPVSRHVTLENAGRALPVLALMLPATGAIYRMVAFAVSAHDIPQRLAVTLPIADLAVIGFGVMAPSLVGSSLLAMVTIGYGRRIALREHRSSSRRMAFVIATAVTLIFVALLAASFVFRGAYEILRGVATAVVALWITWVVFTSPRRLPMSRLVGPILLFSAVTALTFGLRPTTAGTLVTSIRFDAAAGLSDGMFTVLGEDDSTTWLLSCEPGGSPMRVRSDGMVAITLVPIGPIPEPPSLGQMIANGSIQPAGFVQRCPAAS